MTGKTYAASLLARRYFAAELVEEIEAELLYDAVVRDGLSNHAAEYLLVGRFILRTRHRLVNE